MNVETSPQLPRLPFSFKYEWYGTEFPIVTLRDAQQDIQNARLNDRRRLQANRMPGLLGEFIISEENTLVDINIGMAVVRTLEVHAQYLDFKPVFGGCRAPNLYQEGVLFGRYSDARAINVIQKERIFNAVTTGLWLEVLGLAKNNPFDHMFRGAKDGDAFPSIIAYDANLLIELDEGLYIPNDSMSIEQTVKAVYYPSSSYLDTIYGKDIDESQS